MGTRKNGKVVYKVSKKANLNKKLKIDESKIKNSKKRTEALTKEYSSGRTPAKKTPTKKTTPKKTSYIKTGITGGAAQAAKEYRKKNPAKNTKKKETKKKETKKKSNQLTSNEALLLQNLTRTGSKKVVEQGKKKTAAARDLQGFSQPQAEYLKPLPRHPPIIHIWLLTAPITVLRRCEI